MTHSIQQGAVAYTAKNYHYDLNKDTPARDPVGDGSGAGVRPLEGEGVAGAALTLTSTRPGKGREFSRATTDGGKNDHESAIPVEMDQTPCAERDRHVGHLPISHSLTHKIDVIYNTPYPVGQAVEWPTDLQDGT